MSILGEGNTPSIASARVSGLHFKLEQCNPTGSYKDRFIARELQELPAGTKFVIATSSGNTGASLAAYAARFGIRCMIFANADAPAGKVMQMRAHGATVARIPGFAVDPAITDAVFASLRASGVPLIVSAFRYCPRGMAGVETISHELRALNPGHVFVPVGGGGLYSAVVQGFEGKVKVHAVQPSGCATVAGAWRQRLRTAAAVASTTAISGLSVPTDIDATLALTRLYECGGRGIAVSDTEVFDAQQALLSSEGIYCEPAGATAFAGFLRAKAEGWIGAGESAVCLVTGHGFKDPASIEKAAAAHESPLIEAGQVRDMIEEHRRHAG